MSKKERKPAQGIQSTVLDVAYVYTDKTFGEMPVRKSANAWWTNREKVETLVRGFRMDFNDMEACNFAGIYKHQLDYFLEIHPYFSEFFDSCKLHVRTLTKANIYQGIASKDSKVALDTSKWHAEHKLQDEYSTRSQHTGADNKDLIPEDIAEDHAEKIARSILKSIAIKKQDENG